MEIIVKGHPREIAAFVLELQSLTTRQVELLIKGKEIAENVFSGIKHGTSQGG